MKAVALIALLTTLAAARIVLAQGGVTTSATVMERPSSPAAPLEPEQGAELLLVTPEAPVSVQDGLRGTGLLQSVRLAQAVALASGSAVRLSGQLQVAAMPGAPVSTMHGGFFVDNGLGTADAGYRRLALDYGAAGWTVGFRTETGVVSMGNVGPGPGASSFVLVIDSSRRYGTLSVGGGPQMAFALPELWSAPDGAAIVVPAVYSGPGTAATISQLQLTVDP